MDQSYLFLLFSTTGCSAPVSLSVSVPLCIHHRLTQLIIYAQTVACVISLLNDYYKLSKGNPLSSDSALGCTAKATQGSMTPRTRVVILADSPPSLDGILCIPPDLSLRFRVTSCSIGYGSWVTGHLTLVLHVLLPKATDIIASICSSASIVPRQNQ